MIHVNAAAPGPGYGLTMDKAIHSRAPLSPVLLLGLAARPLPLFPLQRALNLAVAEILRRRPGVLARLADAGCFVFLIDPIDLPFVFLLRTDAKTAAVKVARSADPHEVSAAIRGPLLSLMDLLQGRMDGDSLFFSRELVVEGDTEAVVALRNAVDDAEIDMLADLLAPLGPLADPARRLTQGAATLFQRATDDLETLRAAVIAPALRRSDAVAAGLRELEGQVNTLRRHGRARRAEQP
ncbi:MAG: SCP2 sterol-binding domain-containing protein [Rhodospirillales bacterium]|nr:SCP2 sterol-binding domain-containing protein [Rhodospirillales bacterium]